MRFEPEDPNSKLTEAPKPLIESATAAAYVVVRDLADRPEFFNKDDWSLGQPWTMDPMQATRVEISQNDNQEEPIRALAALIEDAHFGWQRNPNHYTEWTRMGIMRMDAAIKFSPAPDGLMEEVMEAQSGAGTAEA